MTAWTDHEREVEARWLLGEPGLQEKLLAELLQNLWLAGYTRAVIADGGTKVRVQEDIRGSQGRWPAIWEAVEKVGLQLGCGSTFQAQFNIPVRSGAWVKPARLT